jgi:hypothetical protein
LPRRWGSWPFLLALAGGSFAALLGLRGSSSFLAIEARHPAAQQLAQVHGLPVAEVLALHDLIGADATAAAWAAAAAEFAALRWRCGPGLAAVVLAGQRDLAERHLAAARGDAAAAWTACRTEVDALAGVRFLLLADRFAARLPDR